MSSSSPPQPKYLLENPFTFSMCSLDRALTPPNIPLYGKLTKTKRKNNKHVFADTVLCCKLTNTMTKTINTPFEILGKITKAKMKNNKDIQPNIPLYCKARLFLFVGARIRRPTEFRNDHVTGEFPYHLIEKQNNGGVVHCVSQNGGKIMASVCYCGKQNNGGVVHNSRTGIQGPWDRHNAVLH